MKTLSRLVILFLMFRGFLLQSQDDARNLVFVAKEFSFPYHLLNPDVVVKLQPELSEISGLQVTGEDHVAAIQDEKGKIYLVRLSTAKVERKIDFGEDGDYEDITLVKDDAWVLKSNGDLFRIINFLDKGEHKVVKYETALSKRNDSEGLCHDPVNNRLLIAAKGHPYLKDEGGNHEKAVYSFDLAKKKLDEKPAYIIDLEGIKNFKKYNTMTRLGISLMANLDSSKGDVTFQPSGLAIHPLTGHIYLIGAVGDLLIVLHPDGEILALVELDDTLFNQPEGICFGPQGDLYISNETGDHPATILRFSIME